MARKPPAHFPKPASSRNKFAQVGLQDKGSLGWRRDAAGTAGEDAGATYPSYAFCSNSACAAASLATGTR